MKNRKIENQMEEVSVFSAGSMGGNSQSEVPSASAGRDLRVAAEKQGRLDPWLEKMGDQFSSIMVKETRQAIKSRHFTWTFFATIIITLVVTFVIMSNESGNSALGQTLLMGYLVILGLPLMIIVPISTFQSLSAEHSDGTLQLISITTMKPSAIIIGKLCSAILQILIYLSVLAPCITFTFLLRGVDVYQIMASLLSAFGCSAALCSLGLAMGSISTTRMISAAMQLIFAGVLLMCAWMWALLAYGLSREFGSIPSDGSFWIAGWCCAILSTAMLLLVAATAQITFASDNRSTYLRVAMLVQQTLFIALMIGVYQYVSDIDAIEALTVVLLHYWLLQGSLMTIAPHQLSNRVRRTMPQTVIGRTLGGLMMPGPGRGYLFAWTNGMFGCAVATVLIVYFNSGSMSLEVIFLSLVYFSLFLSAGYIVNRFVKRHSPGAPIWIGVVGMGIVMFLPTVVVAILNSIDQRHEYFSRSFLSYANWYAALGQVQNSYQYNSYLGGFVGLASVVIAALSTTVYAMLSAAREFSVTAIATPDHVLKEDRDHALRNALGQMEETIDDIF